MNAYVAYSRFINGRGAFYKIAVSSEITTEAQSSTTKSANTENTTHSGSNTTETKANNDVTATDNGGNVSNNGNISENVSSSPYDESETAENTLSDNNESYQDVTDAYALENQTNLSEQQISSGLSNNGSIILQEGSISLTKEFKTKLIISGIILLVAAVLSVILVILKKRNIKNFIVIGVAVLILITSVFCMRINSADDYYNSSVVKGNTTGVVTLTVRCDTIMGKEGAPDNPVILEKTECPINEDDTVYNILAEVLRENGIMFEHNSSYYISGIDNLYEFQFGDLSGWMYRVNGETPSVGCGEYVLKDGDEIEWLYTCEIGNDLK